MGQPVPRAAATKVLAANQGLYNGFLAAGLFWGLWLGGPHGRAGPWRPSGRPARRAPT